MDCWEALAVKKLEKVNRSQSPSALLLLGTIPKWRMLACVVSSEGSSSGDGKAAVGEREGPLHSHMVA